MYDDNDEWKDSQTPNTRVHWLYIIHARFCIICFHMFSHSFPIVFRYSTTEKEKDSPKPCAPCVRQEPPGVPHVSFDPVSLEENKADIDLELESQRVGWESEMVGICRNT